jgi:hypothetical protein
MAIEDGFDLAAAGLRADGADLKISIEALASKLEQALPGQVRVERQGGGLFGRGGGRRVRRLGVELGADCYTLEVGEATVEGSRERRVGGISIKREPLAPDAWLAALAQQLQLEAQRSSKAREALAKLLD